MAAERPNLADKSYTTYLTLWRAHVHSHVIASMPVAAVRPETVEQWLKDRRAIGAGEQSLRKTMALMQTIFERAVRYDRIVRNPVKAIKKPSAKRTSRPQAISPASVERIRFHLGGEDALMVGVLAYTGMRPGEARGLKWRDIGERRISIERAVSGESPKPTKTDYMRTVPLPRPLAADLASARGDAPDDAFVFAREGGRPWTEDDWRNWRRRTFMPAVSRARVKLARPYDLRHSAVSLWLHEGRYSPIQIAQWTGHKPSVMWDTYGHLIEDLDPDARLSADEAVEAARRDISVTYRGVEAGQNGAAGKGSKSADLREISAS